MYYLSCCIGDNLALSKECIQELFVNYYGEFSKVFDEIVYNRHLLGKEDCLEYQDFVNFIRDQKEEVLDILNKYETKGNICFVKMNGCHNADFFGYEFENGKCNKILGIPFWVDENFNQI